MSQINTNAILDASGGTTASINGFTPTVSNMAGRNRIINGNFDIWQRGTSAVTGNNLYSADRWQQQIIESSMSTTQSQFALGQTDVPNNPKYYLTSVVTTASTASSLALLTQKVESVYTFSGQTVTLSFYAKADSNKSIGVEIGQYFGTGGSPSTQATGAGNVVNLTTSWQKHTITYGVPSISGKTLGTNGNDYLYVFFWLEGGSNYNTRTGSIGNQNITFDIAQVQLEAGSVATPFEHRQYGQELALCQRYFIKTPATTTYGVIGYDGYIQAGYFFGQPYTFPVTMRSAPTGTIGGTFAVSNCGQPIVVETDSFGAFVTSVGTGTGNGYFHCASSGFASFNAEL